MIKGKGMSLTGNQKAFAQYLADLWGKPEVLVEMRGLLPVENACLLYTSDAADE